jgi:hypothetical protein
MTLKISADPYLNISVAIIQNMALTTYDQHMLIQGQLQNFYTFPINAEEYQYYNKNINKL